MSGNTHPCPAVLHAPRTHMRGGITFAIFVPKWGNQFRAGTQRTQRRVRGGCRDYPGLMQAEGWRWAQGQR